MNSNKPLTALDILAMSTESEAGSGYLGHPCREPRYWLAAKDPYEMPRMLDQMVADVANDLGFNEEAVYGWAHSKLGRWLGDEIMGKAPTAIREMIRLSMRSSLPKAGR